MTPGQKTVIGASLDDEPPSRMTAGAGKSKKPKGERLAAGAPAM